MQMKEQQLKRGVDFSSTAMHVHAVMHLHKNMQDMQEAEQ